MEGEHVSAARGEPEEGTAFEGHDLVLYPRNEVPWMWDDLCGEPISRGRVVLQSNSAMALFEAVAMMRLGAMPLPPYTALHPESKVTLADLELLERYLAPWSTPVPPVSAAAEAAPPAGRNIPPTPNGLAYDARWTGWRLLALTDRPEELGELLRRRGSAPGISITIGAEHGHPALSDFTVVTAEYRAGALAGVIGVIGPTRMPYDKIITMVAHTSRLISDLLE